MPVSSLREEFAALVRDGARCGLGRGALEIARIAYPDLQPDRYLAEFDNLAEAARPGTGGRTPPEDVALAIGEHLFRACGFHGNTEDYHDPRNSFLNDVLERRTGIPISLSVVFIEVSRRLGLPVEGVGFPGHFLVRVAGHRGPLLLDPFFGGRPVGDAELVERLGALHGGRELRELPREALRTAPTPDILARMLRNLLRVYLSRDDPPHALATVDLLLVLVPDSPDDLRTRGCLYEHLDCVPAAAADFRRFLDLVPDAPDADEIRARLARLPKASQTIH